MPEYIHPTILCRDVMLRPGALLEASEAGRLNPRFKWLGLKGAGLHVAKVAAGDVADDDVIDRRRGYGCCLDCPVRTSEPGYPQRLGWCGEPGIDKSDEDGPCGCRIEGLTATASGRCPMFPPRFRRVTARERPAEEIYLPG